MPLVSIAMPVLNGGDLLERALDDLSAQTFPHLEIVVSDNASDDQTPNVLAAHARRDPRMSVTRTDSTVSMRENFLNVLAASRGEYLVFAAHDDRWDGDYVERLVPHLEADPRVVLAAGIPHVIDERGAVTSTRPQVAQLAGGDRATRMERFILQPEDGGKANLIYGLLRRSVVVDLDLRTFWAADPRRLDYHTVLALLARGPAAVDTDVRFLKTPPERSQRTPLGVAADAVAATWRSWQWLDAYQGVVRDIVADDHERRRLDAAVRQRKRRLLAERARRVGRRRARG